MAHEGQKLKNLVKADTRNIADIMKLMGYERGHAYVLFGTKKFNPNQLKHIGKAYDVKNISDPETKEKGVDDGQTILKLQKAITDLQDEQESAEDSKRELNKKVNALSNELMGLKDYVMELGRRYKKISKMFDVEEDRKVLIKESVKKSV